MPAAAARARVLDPPRRQPRGERPVDRANRLRRRSRELPPLLAQPFHALAKIATGLKAAGIAIDQLIDPRQNHPAGPLGLDLQRVPRLKTSRAKRPRRNRHLMLTRHPSLIL